MQINKQKKTNNKLSRDERTGVVDFMVLDVR